MHELRAAELGAVVYRLLAVGAAPVVAEAAQVALARVRAREWWVLLVA